MEKVHEVNEFTWQVWLPQGGIYISKQVTEIRPEAGLDQSTENEPQQQHMCMTSVGISWIW